MERGWGEGKIVGCCVFELWRHVERGGVFVALPAMGHSDVRGSRLMPQVVTPAFALEDKLPVAPGALLSLRDPDVVDVGATRRFPRMTETGPGGFVRAELY